MSVTVKAFLFRNTNQIQRAKDPEIRRFGVDEGVATNYSYLERRIASLYPNLTGQLLRLYWQDVDGDFISFSSDEELLDAVASLNDTVFRVYITSNDGVPPDVTDGSQSEKPLHPGVTCDGCSGAIHGFRYKCLECPDYDLCRSCEAAGVHGEHSMMRIVRPWCKGPSAVPMMFEAFGGRGRFGGCGFGRGRRHHGPHGHRHHHHHSQSSGDSSSAETGEKHEANSDDDYLKTVGDTVAAFLGPLGINVQVDVEKNGQRQRCGATSEPSSMETENVPTSEASVPTSVAPSAPTSDAPSAPTAPTSDAPSAPTSSAPTVAVSDASVASRATVPASVVSAPTRPLETQVPRNTETTDSTQFNLTDYMVSVSESGRNVRVSEGAVTVTTPSYQPVNVPTSYPGPTYPPQQLGRQLSPESRDQGWTMVHPGGVPSIYPTVGYPSHSGSFGPVQPIQDPYERGLAPHVVRSLNQMKSMGFNNDGGWLTALLSSKNGDIDATLESLKPNFTGNI